LARVERVECCDQYGDNVNEQSGAGDCLHASMLSTCLNKFYSLLYCGRST
jgi:hypothetical protein